MSIYGQLLEAALDERRRVVPPSSGGELLAELLRCRERVAADLATTGSNGDSRRVAHALADELAYDVALIELARGLRIPAERGDFDPPHLVRRRLEDALVSSGVRLSGLDGKGPNRTEREGARDSSSG